MYKPLARLSVLMAITLLVGGLIVLVLDLGQLSRLIVAMTTYNFKSIFAWNIYPYVGFMAIVAGVSVHDDGTQNEPLQSRRRGILPSSGASR